MQRVGRWVIANVVSVLIAATVSAASAAAANPGSGANLNGIAQVAAKTGIATCLKHIDQVTDFITANTESSAFLFAAPSDVDQRLASVSLEINSGNVLSYASASFAPRSANQCGALYEAVVYWQNKCEDVASKGFGRLKRAGVIKQQIQILDGGPAMRVFLMPAGPGCVSIKKELLF